MIFIERRVSGMEPRDVDTYSIDLFCGRGRKTWSNVQDVVAAYENLAEMASESSINPLLRVVELDVHIVVNGSQVSYTRKGKGRE